MITHVNNIKLWFAPYCTMCNDNSGPTRETIKTTVNDICVGGVPICGHCGEDLPLMDNCEVKT